MIKKYIKVFVLILVIILAVSCEATDNSSDSTMSDVSTTTVLAKPSLVPTPSISATAKPSLSPTPIISATPKPSEIIEEIIVPDIKGLYIPIDSLVNKEKLDRWITLADETEINAFVIDAKSEDGLILFDSDNEFAKANDAITSIYNVKEVTDKLHEHDIYVIARVVCGKDNITATKNLSLALKTKSGDLFSEHPGNDAYGAWVNMADAKIHKYLIDIAEELLNKGIDEVQFDYVRFPTKSIIDYSFLEEEPTYYINQFLNQAKMRVENNMLSIDIFGIVCLQENDNSMMGQNLEVFYDNVDYISPMIYPSHFANSSSRTMGNGIGSIIDGQLFEAPDLDPYGVVFNTLSILKKRLDNSGNTVKVRPYIQGFTAKYLPDGYWIEYGEKQFKQQIKAVMDAQFDSWIFWDSAPSYAIDQFTSE